MVNWSGFPSFLNQMLSISPNSSNSPLRAFVRFSVAVFLFLSAFSVSSVAAFLGYFDGFQTYFPLLSIYPHLSLFNPILASPSENSNASSNWGLIVI